MKQMNWLAILMGTSLIPFILIVILHPSEYLAMLGILVTGGIIGIGVVFFIHAPENIKQEPSALNSETSKILDSDNN